MMRMFLLLGLMLSGVPALALCPCGTTGVNCNELLPGVVKAINETCKEYSNGECTISSNGHASCVCADCGFLKRGCYKRTDPLMWNFGLNILVVSSLLCLAAFLIKKHEKETNGNDWVFPSKKCTTTHIKYIGPKFILFYRSFVFLGALKTIHTILSHLLPSGNWPTAFITFTVWNVYLITLTFGIGIYLSYKTVRYGEPTGDSNRLEKIYYILLETALVAALGVTLIFWFVLYPGALHRGIEAKHLTNYVSILVHFCNSVVLYIEFFINELDFNFHHYPYIMCWPLLFGLWHHVMMFGISLAGYDHCPSYPFMTSAHPFSSMSSLVLAAGFSVFHKSTELIFEKLHMLKMTHLVDLANISGAKLHVQ